MTLFVAPLLSPAAECDQLRRHLQSCGHLWDPVFYKSHVLQEALVSSQQLATQQVRRRAAKGEEAKGERAMQILAVAVVAYPIQLQLSPDV